LRRCLRSEGQSWTAMFKATILNLGHIHTLHVPIATNRRAAGKQNSVLLQHPVGSIISCNYPITPGSLKRFSASSSASCEQPWCSLRRIGATKRQSCWPSFGRCPIQASAEIPFNLNKGFHCLLQTPMKYAFQQATSASFRTAVDILLTGGRYNLGWRVS